MRLYDVISLFPESFPKPPGGEELPWPICTLNNELRALSDRVQVNGHLKPISLFQPEGADAYRRSLVFLLGMAWKRLYPEHCLVISHSIGHAYFFYVDNSSRTLELHRQVDMAAARQSFQLSSLQNTLRAGADREGEGEVTDDESDAARSEILGADFLTLLQPSGALSSAPEAAAGSAGKGEKDGGEDQSGAGASAVKDAQAASASAAGSAGPADLVASTKPAEHATTRPSGALKVDAPWAPVEINRVESTSSFLSGVSGPAAPSDVSAATGVSFAPSHTEFTVTDSVIAALEAEMRRIVTADLPILSSTPSSTDELLNYFYLNRDYHSCALLKSLNEIRTQVSRCGNYLQIFHTPLAPFTGMLKYFNLYSYHGGVIMTYPSKSSPAVLPPFKENLLLYTQYKQYSRWIKVMGVPAVGYLNSLCIDGRIKSFIQICETMHHRRMGEIVDVVLQGRGALAQAQAQAQASGEGEAGMAGKSAKSAKSADLAEPLSSAGANACSDPQVCTQMLRAASQDPTPDSANGEIKLILIGGPSSSGKTTFAAKLSYNLRVAGRQPIVLSTDNYFVDRVKTPKNAAGEYDFEHLDAIDRELFNLHLQELIAGRKIVSPVFDFKIGQRKDAGVEMVLPSRGVVIVEGIHALNPLLTSTIPIRNKFLLFIAPLTCINLDDRTRISSRDNRLLRRIIRDHNFRGFSAEKTIQLFDNVKAGENRWVFPHQGRADMLYNTALDYELCVLATYVIPLLSEIKPTSPSYTEAARLLNFLSRIQSVNSEMVPNYSILREFIGGSTIKY